METTEVMPIEVKTAIQKLAEALHIETSTKRDPFSSSHHSIGWLAIYLRAPELHIYQITISYVGKLQRINFFIEWFHMVHTMRYPVCSYCPFTYSSCFEKLYYLFRISTVILTIVEVESFFSIFQLFHYQEIILSYKLKFIAV